MNWSSRTYRARMWVLGVSGAFVLAACRTPPKAEIEVEIRSIGVDAVSHAPVVVLQDHDRKVALPIWIGPAEAQAIAMQMQGVVSPRPMTHDLIKAMLDQAGIELQKVVIQDLKASTYYAQIFLRSGRQDLQIDSRPSDAIALAVRFHRPIFVATGLLGDATTIALEHETPSASTVKVAGVTVQNLTDELAEYFSLPARQGVLVADIAGDAPTALRRGDVILEVDGVAVGGVEDFDSQMRALKDGASARLSVQRGTERLRVQLPAGAGGASPPH